MHNHNLFMWAWLVVAMTFVILLIASIRSEVIDFKKDWEQQMQPSPSVSSTWTEPYGGCKEAARYPGTKGYAQCQAHGLLP